MNSPAKQQSVFDIYAHEYDLITNAQAREAYHTKEVAALIERFRPRTVLDAGCATGLTALLFARQGITTVGLDRSRRMIETARSTRASADLPLTFRTGHFERLPKSLDGCFDLVVCLANSISGVNTKSALLASLKGFRQVLRPDGHLVLQALNYASIKEGQIFPIKATRNGDIIYTRYSRRVGNRLEIHVTRLDLGQNPIGFEPFCHQFDNFAIAELTGAVKQAGFVRTERFADLYLKTAYSRSSRDVVLVVEA